MSYEAFQKRVNALLSRIKGPSLSASFSHDHETGRHYADISDGTTIVGNTIAKKVMISWGSGHRAIANI